MLLPRRDRGRARRRGPLRPRGALRWPPAAPRRTAAAAVALVLGAATVAPLTVAATAGALAPPAGNEPDSYVIADLTSGVILDAKNLHTPFQPASMVKLLTALTAVSNLPPDVRVPVSNRAAAQPVMRIGMPAGQAWPLDDMLSSLLMVSANDAAWAIAECSGGGVEGFAAQGNALMRRLGATDGTFNDPAGLSDSYSYNGGSTLSAWDLAVIGRNALAVPRIAASAATVKREFVDAYGTPHSYTNHNRTFLEGYPGANGLKTGFTSGSGRTLVATATRKDRTILAVVEGTWDTSNWAGALLDRGFATDPEAKGTTLPPVRVRPITKRAGTGAACAPGAATVAAAAATTTTLAPSTTSTTRRREPVEARPTSSTRAATSGTPWRTIAIVAGAVIAVLAVAVVWRRRVVVKRRRQRAARRRSLERAQRAGSMHIVDASVPTGRVDRQATSRAAETDPGTTTRTTRGDR